MKIQQREILMKKYFSTLRRCPLFEGISDEDLLPRMNCVGGKIKNFLKKENIFSEGDRALQVGIILRGKAQIVRIDYWETVLLWKA